MISCGLGADTGFPRGVFLLLGTEKIDIMSQHAALMLKSRIISATASSRRNVLACAPSNRGVFVKFLTNPSINPPNRQSLIVAFVQHISSIEKPSAITGSCTYNIQLAIMKIAPSIVLIFQFTETTNSSGDNCWKFF